MGNYETEEKRTVLPLPLLKGLVQQLLASERMLQSSFEDSEVRYYCHFSKHHSYSQEDLPLDLIYLSHR